jgi:hypothetical protein
MMCVFQAPQESGAGKTPSLWYVVVEYGLYVSEIGGVNLD